MLEQDQQKPAHNYLCIQALSLQRLLVTSVLYLTWENAETCAVTKDTDSTLLVSVIIFTYSKLSVMGLSL